MENMQVERPGWAIVPFALLDNSNALKVWVALWELSDFKTRTATVFRKDLESRAGLSDKSVSKGLRWLKDKEYLKITPVAAPHGGIQCNRYRMLLDGPQPKDPTGNLFSDPTDANPGSTYDSVDKKQKSPPPEWAVKVANAIRAHVVSEWKRAITDANRDKWAYALDRLTRSKTLTPPPIPAEVENVILWGLQDRQERGTWPGWYANIRSAPDPDKFTKIRAARDRAFKGNYNQNSDEDLQ